MDPACGMSRSGEAKHETAPEIRPVTGTQRPPGRLRRYQSGARQSAAEVTHDGEVIL